MTDEPLRVNPPAPRNADGTVTVQTNDHGTIRLACPNWCRNVHSYPRGIDRADIRHNSEPIWALAHTQEYGETGHLEVGLAQYPFAEDSAVYVEFTDDASGVLAFGPAGTRKVAKAIRKHVATIEMLAAQLDVIRGSAR